MDSNILKNNRLQKLTILLLTFTFWISLYSINNEYFSFESSTFKLLCMFVAAKLFGYAVEYIFKIPPIIGQIIIGIIFANIGIVIINEITPISSLLRKLALINILLPAGLGLNYQVIKKRFFTIINLSITPSIVEVLTMTFLCLFFINIPIGWCLLIGLILAAVSPSVVIPCLFDLQSKGYGHNNGIITFIIAASTINDIFSIVAFEVVIGAMFTQSDIIKLLLKSSFGIVFGFIFGLSWGYLSVYIPNKEEKYLNTLRTFMIGIGSIFINFGCEKLGYENGGTLGCVVAAFVASQGWKLKDTNRNSTDIVKKNFDILWKFFEPISFSLIGVEFKLKILNDVSIIYFGLFIFLSLIVRLIFTFIVIAKSNFTKKENLFVVLSYIPKATVQATIGPIALDYVRNNSENNLIEYALKVLIVALVSIVLTAPIGTLLIVKLGPKLLPRNFDGEEEQPLLMNNQT